MGGLWIDINVDESKEIPDKTKLKLIKVHSGDADKSMSELTPNAPDVNPVDWPTSTSTYSITAQSPTCGTSAQSPAQSPVAPAVARETSYKKWPTKYVLPTNRFSTNLTLYLNNKKPLTWAMRKELKDHIVNDMQQYGGLTPPRQHLEGAARAIISDYPYLTEEIGNGYSGWLASMRERFKGLRGEAECDVLAVKLTKKNKSNDNNNEQEMKIKKPKKGEINWQPNFPEGEDDASIARHKTYMKKESAKDSRYQNKESIELKMQATYAARRTFINSQCTVQELLNEYPCLFTPSQFKLEFLRLMDTNLEKLFTENLLKVTPRILELAKSKKKKNEDVLTSLVQAKSRAGPDEPLLYLDSIAALQLLPHLLNDNTDLVMKVYEVRTYIISLVHQNDTI